MAAKRTWTEKGCHTEFSGKVDFEQLRIMHDAFFRDPRSTRAKYRLIDFLEVEEFYLTEQEALHFAALDYGSSIYLSAMKIALIASEPRIAQRCEDYIKLSKRLSSNWEFRFFDNLAEAKAWAVPGDA